MTKKACLLIIILGLFFGTSCASKPNACDLVWGHLLSLSSGQEGLQYYHAIKDNVFSMEETSYKGQTWWDFPKDCRYVALHLYIDVPATSTLYPYAIGIQTIVATGRKVAYYGWLVDVSGKVSSCNDAARWLENKLSNP